MYAVKKCRLTNKPTHCVVLATIYQNIGHSNWPSVRGNEWFFCTDLLAMSRGWPPMRGHLLGEYVNAQRNWPLMPGGRLSEGPFKRAMLPNRTLRGDMVRKMSFLVYDYIIEICSFFINWSSFRSKFMCFDMEIIIYIIKISF